MGLWWLLLITISFASGDFQSYIYDPDEENMIFENNELHYQNRLQSLSNHDVQADPLIKRNAKEEEQGKRQQRFHSWGGKRQKTQNYVFNIKNRKPQDSQEEHLLFPKNVYFPGLNFINGEISPILVHKRAKHPAFSSWGGKRSSVKKRSYSDFVFQPGSIKTRTVDQNRKRYPAFNSWAGKRSAASFNTRGGKRSASPFSGWDVKRVSEEVSEFSTDELEGDEDVYSQEEIFKNNYMFLQAVCNDVCNRMNNLKMNYSQYDKWFKARYWMLLNAEACSPCQNQPWNEQELKNQLIHNMLQEDIFHSLNDLERKKKFWEIIKGSFKVSHKNYPPLGKRRYDTPNDYTSSKSFPFETWHSYNFQVEPIYEEMGNFSKYKDEGQPNVQQQKLNNIGVLPEELEKSPDKEDSLCEQQDKGRDLKCDIYNQKGTRKQGQEEQETSADDLTNENEKANIDSVQSFTANLDSENEQNQKTPNYEIYFPSLRVNLCGKYSKSNNCDNYFTNNANEEEPNKHDSHLLESKYPRLFNWLQKRSPLFRNWYEKKVPTMQLSNGKRRPAFSSWGGKRSEHSQSNVEKCIDGKNCMETINGLSIETAKIPIYEEHMREKRYLKLNNNWATTYENTLNRNKRSNANIKKNRDMSRFVLKGGFVWPFMVKPLSKGVDFYAWGGRR